MKISLYAALGVIFFMAGCSRMSEDELWKRAGQTRAGGNADSTILLCQTILKEYPQGKEAAHALFMLAEAYNGKQDYHNAVNCYSAFAAEYPIRALHRSQCSLSVLFMTAISRCLTVHGPRIRIFSQDFRIMSSRGRQSPRSQTSANHRKRSSVWTKALR